MASRFRVRRTVTSSVIVSLLAAPMIVLPANLLFAVFVVGGAILLALVVAKNDNPRLLRAQDREMRLITAGISTRELAMLTSLAHHLDDITASRFDIDELLDRYTQLEIVRAQTITASTLGGPTGVLAATERTRCTELLTTIETELGDIADLVTAIVIRDKCPSLPSADEAITRSKLQLVSTREATAEVAQLSRDLAG